MILEKKIKIDGATIYYGLAGDKTKPTIVFLHGWPGKVRLKNLVMAELAKEFYVIAPEHPGLARSEPLKKYTNIFEQYADVVFRILNQENLSQSQHIIMGQSFGGSVASAFAEKYKDNTKALILTDAVMGAQKQDLLRKILLRFGRRIILFHLSLPNIIKRRGLKTFFGELSKSKDKKYNNQLIRARVEMIKNYCSLSRQAAKQKNNLLDRSYNQNLPIIMLWGDKDGREFNLAGYSRAKDAKKLFVKLKKQGQAVEFLTVPGGHTVLYKKTEEIVGRITQTLRKQLK